MNARNGKIARLPREIRGQLNQRLERSEQSPQLLDWLNALPEVKELLQNHFAGVPISRQNLSEWRQGGFEEWLARRNLCEDARDVTELAGKMDDEKTQMVLADDVAQVLAARFGSLIANWNGEVDEKFEAKSRILNRLCRSVVQLQRGMHRSKREGFELTCKWEEKEKADEEVLKKRMIKPCYDMLKLPVLAKMFGGGTAGRKIAQYILAIQRGNLDADFDLLPTDKYEIEESAEKEAEPVKPARKWRSGHRATKTKPVNVAKPLQKNELDGGRDDDSSQEESSPVKVNQTDLAPADDGGLGAESGTEESKKSPEIGSSLLRPTSPTCPISPTSPTRPTRPISPEEDSEARELQRVTELAEKGDAYGEYCLGTRYRDGFGVPKDLAKAREWLGKAASQGIGGAKIELHALVLRSGIEV